MHQKQLPDDPTGRRKHPKRIAGQLLPLKEHKKSFHHPRLAAIGVAGAIPLTDLTITDVETVQSGADGVMGNLALASPNALQLPPVNPQEPGVVHIAPPVLIPAEQLTESLHPIEYHARENARRPCPFGGTLAGAQEAWKRGVVGTARRAVRVR
jgi:hypothetical protein